jgi:hypothetical protein
MASDVSPSRSAIRELDPRRHPPGRVPDLDDERRRTGVAREAIGETEPPEGPHRVRCDGEAGADDDGTGG